MTHHLAFRQSESWESDITMQCIDATDDRITTLCTDWGIDPNKAQGGCYVTWKAESSNEVENIDGESVFALVPDDDNVRSGRMLRDRGYAEGVPIAGTYELNEDDELILETPYDGGSVHEEFAFDGPDVVNRISTVKRMGGYSQSTFATEQRVGSDTVAPMDDGEEEKVLAMLQDIGLLSVPPDEPRDASALTSAYSRASRWSTPISANADAAPPPTSAFGSGFAESSAPAATSAFGASATSAGGDVASTSDKEAALDGMVADDLQNAIAEAANQAGIDLTKIPPSMRDDFVASFMADGGKDESTE